MKKIHVKFFIALAVLSLSSNMAHPVTPTYIAERGLSSPMFGYAFSGAMITMFLTAPLYGKLCNYVSTRKVAVFTTLGYAVGQFFFFLARSDAAMFFARVFAGLFAGGMWTATLNYVVNTSDADERGRSLTVYVTVQTVVSALGYFLGGMLGEIRTEISLLSQVGTILVSSLLFRLLCVDDTSYKIRPEQPFRLRDANPFGAFLDVKKYAARMLLLLFVVTALTNIGTATFEQEFNFYIMDHFHLTSGYNGTFKAVIALVSFVVNLTVTMRLVKKTNINFTALPVILCCCVPLGLILLFDNIVPFAVMDITFYGFNAIRTPILQNQITQNTSPKYSNNAMGFYQGMTYLGNLFGGLFAGSLYTANERLPFMVAFGAFCAAAVFTFLSVRTYKKEHPGAGLLSKRQADRRS